ncbi:MAG: PEFG-CTERM sorting domain-containing protein, partial [Nitrosopumilus sp.]
DEIFIVLIDSIETTYEELDSNQIQRTITINFEEGDSTIDIIGTHVVPEFGTITMMIIMIGIATTIIISKNKLQIKI